MHNQPSIPIISTLILTQILDTYITGMDPLPYILLVLMCVDSYPWYFWGGCQWFSVVVVALCCNKNGFSVYVLHSTSGCRGRDYGSASAYVGFPLRQRLRIIMKAMYIPDTTYFWYRYAPPPPPI